MDKPEGNVDKESSNKSKSESPEPLASFKSNGELIQNSPITCPCDNYSNNKKKINWPAWIQAGAAVCIVVITFLYTMYAYEQVGQMKEAVNEAKTTRINSDKSTTKILKEMGRQSKAMQQFATTLEKTDKTSRLRDRALIYFSTPTFSAYPPKGEPSGYIFIIPVQNFGNMPAQSFNIRYAYIDSTTKDDPEIAPVTQAKWNQVVTPKTFGPKEPLFFQLFEAGLMPIDEFRKMKESNGSIGKFILAEATYLDGFSKKRRVTKMGVRFMAGTDGYPSFKFTRNHNCTDDDCPK